MIDCVNHGTGAGCAIPGLTIAGKTGSAENPHGRTHAWFVAYAPAEAPQIAIAIIIENAGHGGEMAAPIAKRIFQAFFNKGGV